MYAPILPISVPTPTSKSRMFMNPKRPSQGTDLAFGGAEYVSSVAAAITGGIEAPLQVIFQVLLLH